MSKHSSTKSLALVAVIALGVGYVVIEKKKQAGLLTAGRFVSGTQFTANLPKGSYTTDPTLVALPADMPDGRVSATLISNEIDSTGKIVRVHAIVVTPSGFKLTVAFDPSQVVSVP